MEDLVLGGMIKKWGVSNWTQQRLAAALLYARQNGKAAPVCDSLQFSIATPTRPVWPGTSYLEKPDERLEWYSNEDVAVLAWECLAKGFMAGKWSRDDTPHHEDGRSSAEITQQLRTNPNKWRDLQLRVAYLSDDNFARRDR